MVPIRVLGEKAIIILLLLAMVGVAAIAVASGYLTILAMEYFGAGVIKDIDYIVWPLVIIVGAIGMAYWINRE